MLSDRSLPLILAAAALAASPAMANPPLPTTPSPPVAIPVSAGSGGSPATVTPIRSRPGTALPLFELAYLITARDYPADARKQRRQGVVEFRLGVDATGRVSACVIDSSSGHAVLDRETCTLATRRARFDPAIDADGQPVPGIYWGRVHWDLGKVRDTPLPGTITRQFEVDADGRVSRCRITRVTGPVARQVRVGPEQCRVTQFAPSYQGEGAPKRQIVTEVDTITVTDLPPQS